MPARGPRGGIVPPDVPPAERWGRSHQGDANLPFNRVGIDVGRRRISQRARIQTNSLSTSVVLCAVMSCCSPESSTTRDQLCTASLASCPPQTSQYGHAYWPTIRDRGSRGLCAAQAGARLPASCAWRRAGPDVRQAARMTMPAQVNWRIAARHRRPAGRTSLAVSARRLARCAAGGGAANRP
jgi:hypothetical protein